MEHKFQKQHRIPQVYLKGFGYKKDDGNYYISVCKVGETTKEEIPVKKFSTDINVFDLPFGSYTNRRNFEKNCGIIENYYPIIINCLNTNKTLIPKHRDALNHFVATLISRDKYIREDISEMLNSENETDFLIDEITKYTGNKEELQHYYKSLLLKDINFIMGYVVNHLVFIFRNFYRRISAMS